MYVFQNSIQFKKAKLFTQYLNNLCKNCQSIVTYTAVREVVYITKCPLFYDMHMI